MIVSGKRVARLLLGVFGVSIVIYAVIPAQSAFAGQITARSLTLQAGATDGGSKASGVVKHLFAFTPPSATAVQSIQFLYCTTASGTCTMPVGLLTTSATLGTQTGVSGWSLVNTTNGAPYLTRGAAIAVNTAVSYQLLTVTNPDGTSCSGTTPNCTFYVRITTFTSSNATTGATDTGTVAASTATQITLSGTMPESLIFCTGATIGTVSSVPDCTSATSGAVAFNQLFSPTSTATATSQMAASTNATSGYVITVNGVTLTSGSNTITANASAQTSVVGTSQFGMNLRANTTPSVGISVTPAANGTNFKGEPAPSSGYDTVDQFKFVSGNTVADSANGGAGPTDAQIFTVSYIVNVAGSQAAGNYQTTLTYICTPTF